MCDSSFLTDLKGQLWCCAGPQPADFCRLRCPQGWVALFTRCIMVRRVCEGGVLVNSLWTFWGPVDLLGAEP